MNIVEPYAKLFNFDFTHQGSLSDSVTPFEFTPNDGLILLRKIEYCARISHRSEDKMTDDSWQRFIKFVVLEKGDWSVVEHASVSVDAVMDRGCTHEWVRHRLFSFTQESTRFVRYKKGTPNFICPLTDEQKLKQVHEDESTALGAWEMVMKDAAWAYDALLEGGVSPQIARSVLPNALASRIITTGNLRNWRHFLIMRTTKETHPQMKQITIPLLKEFQEKIPLLFEDIEPEMKQSEALKRMR